MLRKVAPFGTVIRGVIVEEVKGNISFGRALGSYPLLVGIPMPLKVGEEVDVFVVDHGHRSITALPIPLRINSVPLSALEAIPGVGKGRAKRILERRPFKNRKELLRSLDDPSVIRDLLDFIDLPDEGD